MQVLMTSWFGEVPTSPILVGKSKKPFYIHPALLHNASSFFKAASLKGFQTHSKRTTRLPAEDAESTFDLPVDGLCNRPCEILHTDDADDEDDSLDDLEGDRALQVFDRLCSHAIRSLGTLKSHFFEATIASTR